MYTYTYTQTHAHIYAHLHTYRHKVLPAVYYSSHLVIFSYNKSYQQYFDILLNYKN